MIAKHPIHHCISSDFQRTRRRQSLALTDCRTLLNFDTTAKMSPSDSYTLRDKSMIHSCELEIVLLFYNNYKQK